MPDEYEDLDDDGYYETLNADTNGDGLVDTVYQDLDGDGVIDAILFDANEDSFIDGFENDLDGDGLIDHGLYDVDFDGQEDIESFVLHAVDGEAVDPLPPGDGGWGVAESPALSSPPFTPVATDPYLGDPSQWSSLVPPISPEVNATMAMINQTWDTYDAQMAAISEMGPDELAQFTAETQAHTAYLDSLGQAWSSYYNQSWVDSFGLMGGS